MSAQPEFTPLPEGRPSHRAFYGPLGLKILAWSESVVWSAAHRTPVEIGDHPARHDYQRFEHRGDVISLDVWVHPPRCHVRQIGSANLPLRAIIEIGEWARGQELLFELGPPLPVFVRKAEIYLDPPRERRSAPPTFTFVHHPSCEGGRLRTAPFGFTATGVDRLPPEFTGALGEVHAVNDELAIAQFCVSGDDRDAAERALCEWADRDGWDLRAPAGTRPLTDTVPRPKTHASYSVCPRCGARSGTGLFSHMGFNSRGWIETDCKTCGGRRQWHGFPELAGCER